MKSTVRASVCLRFEGQQSPFLKLVVPGTPPSPSGECVLAHGSGELSDDSSLGSGQEEGSSCCCGGSRGRGSSSAGGGGGGGCCGAARSQGSGGSGAMARRHLEELRELQRRVECAENRAASLECLNAGLRAALEAATSELPAQQVAYEQLQESFFRLQGIYMACRAQRDSLEAANAELQRRLARAADPGVVPAPQGPGQE